MKKKYLLFCLNYFICLVYSQYSNQSKFFNSVDFDEIQKELDHALSKRSPSQSKQNNLADFEGVEHQFTTSNVHTLSKRSENNAVFFNKVDVDELEQELRNINRHAVAKRSPNEETSNLPGVNWSEFDREYKRDLEARNFTRSKRTIDADEAKMFTYQLIQKYGYPAESHRVETSDGYILEIHRIPYGIQSPMCRNKKKPVVLLMHDIIASSSDWIINGPERSLGYILADAGFDVWLGNVRGNRYCRSHRTLGPSNMKFWDFSFHEMGHNDLPAIIDHILKETEQEKIYYIGMSMGTTLYYVLMSGHPEYNDKVHVAIHLSPVVYLSWMRSPLLRFFSIFSNAIGLFFDVVGLGEFLPQMDILTQFGHLMCKGMDFTQVICTSVLFLLSGYNMQNLNETRLPVYMGHTPAGASIKTFVHYGQIIQSGTFKHMDWGVIDNFLRYNNLKPPRYELLKVTTPVYLIYSNNDWFANKNDIDRLYRELQPGLATMIEVKDPQFSHIDFWIGMNAKEMVYDDVLDILKRY